MLPNIGPLEVLVILIIALVVFGPKRLPELGRSLGKGINEFKRASNELKSTFEEEVRIEEQRNAQRAAAPRPAEDPGVARGPADQHDRAGEV